jgi:serine/threonine-protein kinase RsbW
VGTGPRPDGQSRPVVAPFGMRFGLDDLRRVRRETARWSRRAAMPPERAADFVIAVNEVATNAVRHGSPDAWLVLRITPGHVAEAEIRDSGSWPADRRASRADAEHGGMGLPLVRKVCDAVEIRTGRDGTAVILRIDLRAHGTEPG